MSDLKAAGDGLAEAVRFFARCQPFIVKGIDSGWLEGALERWDSMSGNEPQELDFGKNWMRELVREQGRYANQD